jgi:predicted phosphoribosyltransferase
LQLTFFPNLILSFIIVKRKPAKLVVAVPVGAPDTLRKLSKEVDDIICIFTSPNLNSIGLWYYDFTQTEDQEVLELLDKSEKMYPIPTTSSCEKLQSENVNSVESL